MLVSNCFSSLFACLLSFFASVSYLGNRSLAQGGGGRGERHSLLCPDLSYPGLASWLNTIIDLRCSRDTSMRSLCKNLCTLRWKRAISTGILKIVSFCLFLWCQDWTRPPKRLGSKVNFLSIVVGMVNFAIVRISFLRNAYLVNNCWHETNKIYEGYE